MFSFPDEGQKRSDERLDVLWQAIATFNEEDYPCEVANVSTAGALMKLDQDLSEGFQFILDVKGLDEYAAVVAWANRPYYGLRLLVGEDLQLKNHADKVGLNQEN